MLYILKSVASNVLNYFKVIFYSQSHWHSMMMALNSKQYVVLLEHILEDNICSAFNPLNINYHKK